MHPATRSLLTTGAVDHEQIKRSELRIRKAHRAANTLIAYQSAWRSFARWCEAAERQVFPAESQTVQDFSTWCFDQGYRLETVFLRMSAIRYIHREEGHQSPIDKRLREHLANARRHLKEKPGGKAALSYDLLRRIARRFSDNPIGVRNRAMILLGFASGWRRSEIVSLHSSDIRFVPRGMELWLASSKTDQTGTGRLVGIEPGRHELTCPLRALRQWIECRGNWTDLCL